MHTLEVEAIDGAIHEEIFVSVVTGEKISVYCDCELGQEHPYRGRASDLHFDDGVSSLAGGWERE
jgi:hypothetical protein